MNTKMAELLPLQVYQFTFTSYCTIRFEELDFWVDVVEWQSYHCLHVHVLCSNSKGFCGTHWVSFVTKFITVSGRWSNNFLVILSLKCALFVQSFWMKTIYFCARTFQVL